MLTTGLIREQGPWLLRRNRPGLRSAGRVRLGHQGSPDWLEHTGRLLRVEDAVIDLCTLERCREVANGANSALELSFARKVERPHGLPRGRRQKSRLGLPYQSDVGYAVSTLRTCPRKSCSR